MDGKHWEWEERQQGHGLIECVSALDMGWCLCLCVEQASEVSHLMGSNGDTCQECQCALGRYTLPHFEPGFYGILSMYPVMLWDETGGCVD